MKLNNILCPIDFSEPNHAANQYASMLAQSTGARITYYHVYLPDPYTSPPDHYDAEKTEQELTDQLKEFVKPTNESTPATYVVEYGVANEDIAAYANKHDFDLVVMATQGRTGLRRILLGSVAESVIRSADCPVLALRANADVPAETQ